MIQVVTNLTDVVAMMAGKIASLEQGGAGYDSLLRVVSTSVIGPMKTRIHEKGIATDGSKIGDYSRKPMYVSANANVGKSFGRPIGKTGKSKFVSGAKKGTDHKSRYFPGGYYEYKTAIGRNQIGTVNLSLSGQLNNQLSIQTTGKGYGIGWADAEKFKIAKAMEKKYGKPIWLLSSEEKQIANKVAEKYIKNALS